MFSWRVSCLVIRYVQKFDQPSSRRILAIEFEHSAEPEGDITQTRNLECQTIDGAF